MAHHIFNCDIFPASAADVRAETKAACDAYFGDIPYTILHIETDVLNADGTVKYYRTSISAKATP